MILVPKLQLHRYHRLRLLRLRHLYWVRHFRHPCLRRLFHQDFRNRHHRQHTRRYQKLYHYCLSYNFRPIYPNRHHYLRFRHFQFRILLFLNYPRRHLQHYRSLQNMSNRLYNGDYRQHQLLLRNFHLPGK